MSEPTPVPERPWPSDVPKDPLEVDKAATVNLDGEVLAYPATNEPMPEEVRLRRQNRAKVPKGYKLKVKRKDGKSEAYWLAIAEAIMDQTGISPTLPVPPGIFQQDTAGKFCMMKGYTTLERIELALQKCERKLADENLSEAEQREWMTSYRGMLEYQTRAMEELKKSAATAEAKAGIPKPRNLPPSIVVQQNFGSPKAPETSVIQRKSIDSAPAISDTLEVSGSGTPLQPIE